MERLRQLITKGDCEVLFGRISGHVSATFRNGEPPLSEHCKCVPAEGHGNLPASPPKRCHGDNCGKGSAKVFQRPLQDTYRRQDGRVESRFQSRSKRCRRDVTATPPQCAADGMRKPEMGTLLVGVPREFPRGFLEGQRKRFIATSERWGLRARCISFRQNWMFPCVSGSPWANEKGPPYVWRSGHRNGNRLAVGHGRN